MATTQPPKPPLEDPLAEKELFANEVVGVGMQHGNITITLASVRFDEPLPGAQSPKMRRVIVGRVVLTNIAAGELLRDLQKLSAQIEAAAARAQKVT